MAQTTSRREGLTPREIDFVSPYSLENCVYLLGRLHDRRSIPYAPPLHVWLDYVDDCTVAFEIAETLPAPIRIYGYLNRLDGQSTYVSARLVVNRQRIYREAVAGVVVIGLLALVIHPLIMLLYLPAFGVFMWFYRRGVEHERLRLLRILNVQLSYRAQTRHI